MVGWVGKQTLVSLYCIFLCIAHCIGPLLHRETDEIIVIYVVIQILCAARVDQRFHQVQIYIYLSSGRDEIVNEGLIGTGL